MDNKVKEKLTKSKYRDDNNGALLVELCQKAIAICETHTLYNENGDQKALAQVKPDKDDLRQVLDDMDNEVNEKLTNYRDGNNGALLVKLCQKASAICETYALYNENGD